MNAKRRKWLGVLAGLFLLGVVIGGYAWMTREPTYQGKSLSEWLEALRVPGGFRGGGGGGFSFSSGGGIGVGFSPGSSGPVVSASENSASKEAKSALVELGPRAAPHLAERILAREPPWKKRLMQWMNKVPWLDWDLPDVSARRSQAVKAFQIIGAEGRPAVPKLIKGLRQPWSRSAAIQALGHIGPGARESLPVLLELLTDTRELPKPRILVACQRIGVGSEAIGPLIEVVKAAENRPSWLAASMLGGIGAEVEMPLMNVVKNEDLKARARCSVAWTLGSINELSPSTIDALIDLACDNSRPLIVRQSAVNALGRIGIKDKVVFERIANAVRNASNWDLKETVKNGNFETPDLDNEGHQAGGGSNDPLPPDDTSAAGTVSRFGGGFPGERKFHPGQEGLPGWGVYEGMVNIRRNRDRAPKGLQIMELGPRMPPGCLAQTLVTAPGKAYQLSFFAAPGRNDRLRVEAGTLRVTLKWNKGRGAKGEFQDSGSGGFGNGGGRGFGGGGFSAYSAPFHPYSFEFRTDSWLTTVTFCAIGNQTYGPMIDNVALGKTN